MIASYLEDSFRRDGITSAQHAREATVTAGLRRVRPCLMTTATTLLALIPVLTSTKRAKSATHESLHAYAISVDTVYSGTGPVSPLTAMWGLGAGKGASTGGRTTRSIASKEDRAGVWFFL